MTEFNLGVLSAYATIDDAPFNAKYPKLVARFRALFGEATKAAAGVDKLDTSLAEVADVSSAASASLSRVTNSTTRAAAAQTRAAGQAKAFADAQERVNATMAQYAGESRKVQQAALRVAAAEDRLNAVMTAGTATTRQLAAAQASLIGAQERLAASQMTLGKRFGAMNAGALTLGRTLTSKVTMPLLALGIAGGVMATRFDAQMTRIQTQAGASAASVKSLTASVLAMRNVQFGPQDLATALYHLKSVGLDDAAAMKALRVSQDLAAVGGANLEDTTNALAGAWRTGIAGAKNFGQAAATVNSIIGAGNMTLTAFTTALGTGILPSAKTFGLTLKEVGAALALFTDEGVPADAAATRLRMTFSLLGAPTEKATKLLAGIGISQYQLGNDLRKPNGLIVAVSDLKDHLDATGMSATQQAALLSRAFGGGRSSSAILSMINNLDVLKKKQDQVNASTAKYAEDVRKQRQTPAAKFAIDLANLEKAGVLLGNEILPDLTELADDATSVVRGFNNLSSGARHFIIVMAGVAALSGPVIRLGARILMLGGFLVRGAIAAVRFAQGVAMMNVATKTYSTGAFRAGFSTRAWLSQYGAGVGIVAGVTLAVVALGKGISELVDHGRASISVMENFASQTNAWGNALVATNGAITENVRLQVAMALQANGLALKAARAGISLADLTTGVTGSDKAFNGLISTWQKLGAPSADTVAAARIMHISFSGIATGIRAASTAAHDGAKHFGALAGPIGLVDRKAEQTGKSLTRFDGSVQSLGDSAKITAGSASTLSRTTNNLATAENNAWLAGKKLAQAIQELGGKQMTTAQAQIAMQQGLQGLKSAFDKNSSAILGNSSAALQNRLALIDQIQKTKDYAATLDHGKNAAQNVRTALLNGIGALRSQATQIGVTKGQWAALIRQMHLTPHDITVALHASTYDAMHGIAVVQQAIRNIDGTVILHTRYAGGASSSRGASLRASGGGAPEGWYWTGEGGAGARPELNYKRGAKTEIFSNAQSKNIASMLGMKVPGFASGTAAASKAVTKASDALTNVSLNSSGFSFVQFTKQIAAAVQAVAAAMKTKASSSELTSLRDRLKRAERKGDELERKLGRSIHGAANKLGGSLADLNNPASVGDVRGQLHTLEGLLRQAGLPKQFINGLDQENRHILALVKVRDQAAHGLAKANSAMASARAHEMNDYRSFASASRGAFDITNPVASGKKITAGSLRAGQAQALTRVRQWVSGITKLAGKHIFPASYLRQLAGGGPTAENLATVQALLSMSGAGLKDFAHQERQIAALSGQEGRVVAGRLDSHQLRVADRRVQHAQERETRAQEHMVHALDEFGHRIVHALQNHHLEAKIKGGDLVVILRHGQRDAKAHHRTGRNLLGATP